MKIFGTHDKNTLDQIFDVSTRAVKTALMADGHMGYFMPIGGVAAYDNQVSLAGVGFDIACGNCAIKTNLRIEDHFLVEELADEIFNEFAFGVGTVNRSKDAPRDVPLFKDGAWDIVPAHCRASFKAKARDQLGTIGSGNHYIDVLVDEDGYVWVGVHFGSRGFGHGIATAFNAMNQGLAWGDRAPEAEGILDLNTQLGQDYWALMTLAGEYAYEGREWVTRKVVKMLGGVELEMVHNHHNFAWKERHPTGPEWVGKDLIVVRKGATPAFPGQRGFVGGSMGDNAVILEGTDDEKLWGENVGHDWTSAHRMGLWHRQEEALFSTVHGAGRVMSRTEAKGKKNKQGEVKKEALVTQEMMDEWLKNKGVIRRGGGVDESPHAYRRLDDVLKDQDDTITVLHNLRPIIACMAD